MADATSALVVSAVSRCARSMLGPSRAIKLCSPDLDSAGGGVEAMPLAVFDGSGLLKVLSVKHPAAMLLYESVKGQGDEAGCASTLLLSLVGPLMDRLLVLPISTAPIPSQCTYPIPTRSSVGMPAVCTLKPTLAAAPSICPPSPKSHSTCLQCVPLDCIARPPTDSGERRSPRAGASPC